MGRHWPSIIVPFQGQVSSAGRDRVSQWDWLIILIEILSSEWSHCEGENRARDTQEHTKEDVWSVMSMVASPLCAGSVSKTLVKVTPIMGVPPR